ncbi:MAG: D-glycero-beta-D-manno-heptose 1-phosphate adenylyltransferase [Caulobacteraceae bacterium]
MDLSALQPLLSHIERARAVVVGDLMVDRYVSGEVSRVSPEAPIPVLNRRAEAVMLGAAGNVARNLAALGVEAGLIGVVGSDAAAHEAAMLIGSEVRIESFIVTDPDRATTTKTRFVAAGQQLLRVDDEDARTIGGEIEQRLCRTIREASAGAGVMLVSDYGKGVATQQVIETALEVARAARAPLIIDSKAEDFSRYGEVDLIKPNAAELARVANLPVNTDEEIEAALEVALASCAARAILVTRGAKGMSLARRAQAVQHFRTEPAEVFDSSGAGDTVMASLGAALAAGASLDEAIALGLLASRLAVAKAGSAVVTPDELLEAAVATGLAASEAKIATSHRAAREAALWRERGLRVGFTNGCFDILHPGHVSCLHQARAWCDRLIVGLNTDEGVKALKGAGRPVNPLQSRAMVLAALAFVDLVVPFEEPTPMALIEAVKPDLLVKGGDYSASQVVGGDLVRAWGGEVRIAPLVAGQSTTAAIRRAGGGR